MLAGEVSFARMSRLSALVTNREGAAHVNLHFGVDEQGTRFISGHIDGYVELVCQRCLDPVLFPVEIDVRLGIVESEQQAERLPAQYDPLLVSQEPLLVSELVEDEILLALPSFPRHEAESCGPEAVASPLSKAEQSPSRENPFAVLARLKSR